ncbi:YlxR family protein [Leucobacter sp. G161]|uniref:YlxR family protein n=1 Tax=Leucobacter sp. G161 TaxID=663704 RepID=UPI0009FA0CAE|nr:YlxR family protein [Leucobacter sp. G161]
MDPIRTCVACRTRAARAELLRVVVRDGHLIIDDRAVLPGRGAWVHETAECMNLAVQRGTFARALRASRQLDVQPLENRLKMLMDK